MDVLQESKNQYERILKQWELEMKLPSCRSRVKYTVCDETATKLKETTSLYFHVLNLNKVKKYKIVPVLLKEVFSVDSQGNKKYNSNNHGVCPDNYNEVLAQTDTSRWIDFKPHYVKITIDDPKYLRMIKSANRVGCITGRMPSIFIEELKSLIESLQGANHIDKCFVRVNNVSLKYGLHGVGPYRDFKSIIESAVTCLPRHSPISEGMKALDIYLIPWVNINPAYEYRVFVYEDKITAISQQNLYTRLYNAKHIAEIPKMLNILTKHYVELSSQVAAHNRREFSTDGKKILPSSYCYDVAIVDELPYFIEMNSFGKEYASGSALFHWLRDEAILYNLNPQTIEFRYTF